MRKISRAEVRRVDSHGKAQLFFQKDQLLRILRVADPAMVGAPNFGKNAAQKVDLIGAGGGDDQIAGPRWLPSAPSDWHRSLGRP